VEQETAMHDFIFKKNDVSGEKVKMRRCQKGGTPFYVYSYNTIADHFTRFKKHLRR